MGSTHLTTVDDIIVALGGKHNVAAKADVRFEAVCNWEREGSFPPRTYVAFQTELQRLGKTAPASLWRMIAPQHGAAE